jgi:SEC-C motif-containing protein
VFGDRIGATSPCPCDSGATYAACCRPLHTREREAAGVEELMRSRYSAYAVGDLDHVFRTWHPRTRPAAVTPGDLTWTGLDVLEVVQGDETGVVSFVAHHVGAGGSGELRERSRFERRGGRWLYVDAED